MKDEKKVKPTEEVKPEEKGVQLTDEELNRVSGGKEQIHSVDGNFPSVTFTTSAEGSMVSK